MRLIKDKRGEESGFLAEHVINILVAVIVLGVLIMLGVAIFRPYLDKNPDQGEAERQIKLIQDKIVELENSGGEREYILITPKSWALSAWPFTSAIQGERLIPNDCKNFNTPNCICFCYLSERIFDKNLDNQYNAKELMNSCNSGGVCIPVRESKLSFNEQSITFLGNINYPIIVDQVVREKKKISMSLSGDTLTFTLKPI